MDDSHCRKVMMLTARMIPNDSPLPRTRPLPRDACTQGETYLTTYVLPALLASHPVNGFAYWLAIVMVYNSATFTCHLDCLKVVALLYSRAYLPGLRDFDLWAIWQDCPGSAKRSSYAGQNPKNSGKFDKCISDTVSNMS